MLWLKRFLPYIPYLGLALLVMGPLLMPGYVLTMDMVFTPVLRLPDHVDNTWLLYAVLHILDILLPADMVQKLLLLAILLLSGVGVHRLLWAVHPTGDRYWRWAVYAAATFYMVNPYVYDRSMAGQWGVWFGYALLPWFARSLLSLILAPSGRTALHVGLWLTLMSIVSIHSVGYAVLLIIVAVATQMRSLSRLRVFVRYLGISIGLFVVASAYWLVPTLGGQGKIALSLATFSPAGSQAFATVDAIGTGTIGAVVGLLGFWQERRDLFVTPIESYPLWGVAYLLILGLLGLGAVIAWRRQRDVAVWALAAGLLSIVLAIGLASELSRFAPFMAGYREPQKFAAVWALIAAYVLAWSVSWLAAKTRAKYLVVLGCITLVMAYTPVMLWGAAGQLRVTDYPTDWFRANQILNQQQDTATALVLPWHLYMSYSFTHGRIIASPAHAFYDRGVVASDNPELPGVAPQTRDATREAVQGHILPAGLSGRPIGDSLRKEGIGYVIVNKDLDWEAYGYIANEPGVTTLYDGPNLRLYRLAR